MCKRFVNLNKVSISKEEKMIEDWYKTCLQFKNLIYKKSPLYQYRDAIPECW